MVRLVNFIKFFIIQNFLLKLLLLSVKYKKKYSDVILLKKTFCFLLCSEDFTPHVITMKRMTNSCCKNDEVVLFIDTSCF